jgi:hypothetical protein
MQKLTVALFLLACSASLADSKADAERARMKKRIQAIHNAAFSAFNTEHADTKGNVTSGLLPPSTSLTPSKPCCQQPGKLCDGKTGWDQPGYAALIKSDTDPTPYRYQFSSKGTGKDATFTIRAVGDLACDGHEEIWELTVHAKSDYELPEHDPKQVRRIK